MTRVGDRWSLIVPVKRLESAKTRLAVDIEARADLAVAMAYDTVCAALSCDEVAEVVVVTDDVRAHQALAEIGARIVPDTPDAGLNAALEFGATNARSDRLATVSSDLPALRSSELATVLTGAAAHQQSVVADLPGSGTTIYAVTDLRRFAPRFGPESFAAHRHGGAVDITSVAGPSVRQDVDTIEALRDAVSLGIGPATEKALASLEI